MYTNEFLAMDFTEEGKGVVFHYLNESYIAEEYIFEEKEDTTHFYMCCLRFFEAVEFGSPVEKQKLFREFLDTNFLNLTYSRHTY
ncbi:hypothetical protein LZ578_09635 [Jeotgalibaca sp. MA1X17-3]|uniref:hypothetical protein n=1 Tax=Jeotgalibaca sp. MA1X17-3 TaxID=2908211 RepID=UPI001F2ECEF3|nr:hypothetical protein [Jeotgalibaca sp. MA1X17-3]UJF15228.1 hypothetical protein LZ578_09635 [Jeotgalibaca sp. MA1X17-3]